QWPLCSGLSGRLAPEQADDFLRFTRSISPEYASTLYNIYLSRNKKFHHTLYQAAEMPILLNMIEQL
ncbi:hypothetical protein D1AOALGA4SA_12867, partial [Olavius algarvensis Delta 1 endosymbiont]